MVHSMRLRDITIMADGELKTNNLSVYRDVVYFPYLCVVVL